MQLLYPNEIRCWFIWCHAHIHIKSTTLHYPTTLILCVLFKISQKHPMATCFCLARQMVPGVTGAQRCRGRLGIGSKSQGGWRSSTLGSIEFQEKLGESKPKETGFFPQVLKITCFYGSIPGNIMVWRIVYDHVHMSWFEYNIDCIYCIWKWHYI